MTEEENGRLPAPGPNLDDLRARYERLLRAMQSGVAMTIELTLTLEVDPKHLRVGVNSAMVEHAALVELLRDKGVINDLEYYEALVAALEREVLDYERRLTAKLGRPVRLG